MNGAWKFGVGALAMLLVPGTSARGANQVVIDEVLGGCGDSPAAQGGLLGKLGGLLGGASAGSVLSGGLGDLVDRFKQAGHGETADSWVRTGPNQPLRADQLQQAIGPDVLATLQQQTGLSQDELLARLTRELPNAVDQLTPHGRLPTEAEASRLS